MTTVRQGGTRKWRSRVTVASACAFALVLSACQNEPDWHATPLPADFPELEFELTGESGRQISQDAFHEQVVVLAFGFTHCPDVCPATLARLSAALESLPAPAADRTRVLFVSVDPARDHPDHLARYTASFGQAFTGATADEARLHALLNRYGASFARRGDAAAGGYFVDHPSSLFVFDRDGRARLLVHADASVDEIAEDLGRLAARGAG